MRAWLTLKQAGRLSRMTPRLVLLLCRSGIVGARVVRGRWWVHRGEFAPWTSGPVDTQPALARTQLSSLENSFGYAFTSLSESAPSMIP
jgi:hypothetical protein